MPAGPSAAQDRAHPFHWVALDGEWPGGRILVQGDRLGLPPLVAGRRRPLPHRHQAMGVPIARAWRAPEPIAGYGEAARRLGIPLTTEEVAAIRGVYRCFRAHMITDAVITSELTGRLKLAYLESQVAKFETAPH